MSLQANTNHNHLLKEQITFHYSTIRNFHVALKRCNLNFLPWFLQPFSTGLSSIPSTILPSNQYHIHIQMLSISSQLISYIQLSLKEKCPIHWSPPSKHYTFCRNQLNIISSVRFFPTIKDGHCHWSTYSFQKIFSRGPTM